MCSERLRAEALRPEPRYSRDGATGWFGCMRAYDEAVAVQGRVEERGQRRIRQTEAVEWGRKHGGARNNCSVGTEEESDAVTSWRKPNLRGVTRSTKPRVGGCQRCQRIGSALAEFGALACRGPVHISWDEGVVSWPHVVRVRFERRASLSKRFTAASDGTNQVEFAAPFFLERPAILSQNAPAFSTPPNRPTTRAAASEVPGRPPMASWVTSR